MIRILAIFIILFSILAVVNAALVYKRSTYFETNDRVNLQGVIEHVETLEQQRLVELSRQLALMSDADFETLNLLSEEFRRAIIYLVFCLVSAIAYLVFVLVYYRHTISEP